MTDYLELLLEQWQDEEKAEVFDWKQAKAGHYRAAAEELRQVESPKGPEQPESDARARDDAYGRRMDRQKRIWTVEDRSADVVGQMVALARAVARGNTEQKAQGQVRTRAAVGAVQTMGGYNLERMSTAAPGIQRGLAGVLDAAFERDARRYDGPLGLF